MTRRHYLDEVLALYLSAPDTPQKPRRADWAIATTFHQEGISIGDIAYVIQLSALRRIRRPPEDPPLEPICSLAYIRPMLRHLRRQPPDPGYVEYVEWSYRKEMESGKKTAGRRRNPVVCDRR